MRVFRLVAGLFVVGLASAAAHAEEPDTGRLLGTVTSDAEAPFETLLVTASGPSGTTVATCDAAGRFEFSNLHPGLYLLRAHASGFTTAAATSSRSAPVCPRCTRCACGAWRLRAPGPRRCWRRAWRPG